MIKILLTITISFIVSACSISQTVEQANLPDKAELCIVKNPKVREGFLKEFEASLKRKNIPYRVVKHSFIPHSCTWRATYTATWRWDLALYMSYAEIKIFHHKKLDGRAVYDSTRGSANLGKFIDAKSKIQDLVNELIQVNTSSLFSRVFG